MRIWFDISNSPHVNMFFDLIKELESNGHSIVITSRPLANTIALLNQKGLEHTSIGIHYGKNIFKKIIGFPIRVYQLYDFLNKKSIDLAISQSSFHSPIVARLLNIPSIYTNDNEHALGNLPSFLFATKILLPQSFKYNNKFVNYFIHNKIINYPGIKEGIYLWVKFQLIKNKRSIYVNTDINIYIRPEPMTAQYYNGSCNFLDQLICDLQFKYKVTILTRNNDQYKHFSNFRFPNIILPTEPQSFDEIATKCTLFIGAGGSMTRELAILGIPTISVYQDILLEVDRLLISNKLMYHHNNLSIDVIDKLISNKSFFIRPNSFLKEGEMAYNIIKSTILSFE